MNLAQIVESLLFASHEPLSVKALSKAIKGAMRGMEDAEVKELGKVTEKEVSEAIEELNRGYARRKNAFVLMEGPIGWKFYTRPEYAVWVRRLFPEKKPERLSPPALETLAIIAYRQPITKADIEVVRGVSVDAVLQTIIERGLAHVAGRAELPGRPLLYETTQAFLEHFGIKTIDDLPNAGELRKVDIPALSKKEEEAQKKAAEEAEAAEAEEQLVLAAAGASGEGEEASAEAGAGEEGKAGEPGGEG